MEQLINDLRNLLKGRSNIIMKEELQLILDKNIYDFNKQGNIIEKGFWNNRPINNLGHKGLIPKLWNEYKFRSMFSDKEWNELEQIKKDSFLKKFRELAKELGEREAVEKFKRKVI